MENEIIHILLAEKTNSDTSWLEDALAQIDTMPCAVQRVNTLDAARTCMEENTVDVLLVDSFMLDDHGLIQLATIHEDQTGLPIILLAETIAEERAIRAMQSGVNDYLIKEKINPDILNRALLYAFKQNQIKARMIHYSHELQNSERRFLNLITQNADGVIVIDPQGVIQFCNPAAEQLLARNANALIGQIFGYPVVGGETAEMDIVRPDGEEVVSEMRIVDIEWENEPSLLISFRDITQHKRTEEALRTAEATSRSILNSINAHIALLAEDGTIEAVNDSWNRFARENGDPDLKYTGVGVNYFDICNQAAGFSADEAPDALHGIRNVLHGTADLFEMEYPCHAPTEERWFMMRVKSLVGSSKRQVVISHTDITERRHAARVQAAAEANAQRLVQLEQELQSLVQLSHPAPIPVSRGMFGAEPLRKSAPEQFSHLITWYDELIEAALEQRAMKVDHHISDKLRVMASQLGFLLAGPRDVIEIHSTVLQHKTSGDNPLKEQAYLEEGRLMVLELMGYLVSYYRSYALGRRQYHTSEKDSS
ncbi:MAG: PAS domain-containing protein [Chloroflexaceae bacterium]|nr:PAS domain-containing protein [Chloroflexaceae bacterium]